MSNEHKVVSAYVGLDGGGCVDVGVIKFRGFTLVGDAELETLKEEAAKFRMVRAGMQVGAVRTDLPLYRVAHWHGFDECKDEGDIDNAINRAMASLGVKP